MSELQVFNFRCSDHGEGTEMVACEECWDLMRSAGVKAEARAQAAEARVVELEEFVRKTFSEHYESDDCWYSCPKSESYCNEQYEDDPRDQRPCDCGKDAADKLLNAEDTTD